MGNRTRAQLMAHAGLAAGNDDAVAFVRTWLNAWLSRTAKSWAWPILKQRIENLPIAAGDESVSVGMGDHTSLYIHRIYNPLFIYTADKKTRGRLFIRELIEGNPDNDQSATNAADRLGMPNSCRIYTDSTDVFSGKFKILPDPCPDRTYYIAFDAHVIPPDIDEEEAADAEKPWYQEDKTLLQACKCAIMEYDDGGEGGASLNNELAKLADMVVNDRDFNGEGPGDGQVMALDKGVFR